MLYNAGLPYNDRCEGVVAEVVFVGAAAIQWGAGGADQSGPSTTNSPITQITQAGQDHTGWHKITQRHHRQAENNDPTQTGKAASYH